MKKMILKPATINIALVVCWIIILPFLIGLPLVLISQNFVIGIIVFSIIGTPIAEIFSYVLVGLTFFLTFLVMNVSDRQRRWLRPAFGASLFAIGLFILEVFRRFF